MWAKLVYEIFDLRRFTKGNFQTWSLHWTTFSSTQSNIDGNAEYWSIILLVHWQALLLILTYPSVFKNFHNYYILQWTRKSKNNYRVYLFPLSFYLVFWFLSPSHTSYANVMRIILGYSCQVGYVKLTVNGKIT